MSPKPSTEPTFLRKILAIAFRNKSDYRHGAGVLVLMFFAACLEALGIGLVIPFVALLGDPEAAAKGRSFRAVQELFGVQPSQLVTVFGLLLVTAFVVKNVYLTFVQWIEYRFIHHRQVKLQNELLETYLRRPYTFHLENNSSELIHNVNYEVSQVFHHVVVSMFVIAVEGLSILVILVLLVALEPVAVPLVGLVLGGISALFYKMVHRRATRLGEEQRNLQTDMAKSLQQGLGGVKEARVMGCEDFFVKSYVKSSIPYGHTLVAHRIITSLPRFVLETTGVLALVLITIAMYARGATGSAVLPVLGALAVAAVRLLPSAAHIIASTSLIRYCKENVEALYKALEPMDGDGKRGRRQTDVVPLPLERELKLVDLEYKYPTARKAALRGVSLTVRRGESIALVGTSGAGKTTLADVIIGLLEPQSGHLEVDGEVLEGERLVRWQRAIGYIPQTVFLCDDTIRRNIAFGVADAEIDQSRIERAASAARLDDWIASLPDGLDSEVGERGVRISGGQRQRIGIARALYLDAKILVLDEATSSLDGTTEQEIVDQIETLRSDRTMIVIAHRLSTVRHCNRLVMTSDGKVAAQGSWDDLYQSNAEFRKMVDQAEQGVPKVAVA